MRLAFLSDTHMRHQQVAVPPCDVLVHCGDFTRRGRRDEVEAFLDWFARQPARAAHVCIGGNHDAFCEQRPEAMAALAAERGVIYLCDTGREIAGLSVWGSPATPAFRSMAFNRERGAPIRAHWDRIPSDLDLLLTHGPPRGLGDRVFFGARVGCADLRAAVEARPPRLHAFGHIHEGFGEYRAAGVPTRFLNVATRRLLPRAVRRAVIVDYPASASQR